MNLLRKHHRAAKRARDTIKPPDTFMGFKLRQRARGALPEPPSGLTLHQILKAKEILDANEVPTEGRYVLFTFNSRYQGKRRRRALRKWNKGMLSRFI